MKQLPWLQMNCPSPDWVCCNLAWSTRYLLQIVLYSQFGQQNTSDSFGFWCFCFWCCANLVSVWEICPHTWQVHFFPFVLWTVFLCLRRLVKLKSLSQRSHGTFTSFVILSISDGAVIFQVGSLCHWSVLNSQLQRTFTFLLVCSCNDHHEWDCDDNII